MTLEQAFRKYHATNTRIRSQRTVNAYRSVFGHFGRHLERAPTVDDLTDETVGLWFRARATEVGPNTLNSEAATLLAIWKWCARKGHAPYPDIVPPQRVRRRPQSLTHEDVFKLFEAAYVTKRSVRGVPGKVLWPAVLGLFVETAERTGAVLAIEWDRIDLDKGWIYYPAETRKNGVDDLVHPISPVMRRDLAKLRECCPNRPFDVIRHTRFYEPWHVFCAEAKMAERVVPKTIRKTVASHLPTLEEARRKLGHRSSTTTSTYYRDETIHGDRSSTDLLAALRNPPRKGWGWPFGRRAVG